MPCAGRHRDPSSRARRKNASRRLRWAPKDAVNAGFNPRAVHDYPERHIARVIDIPLHSQHFRESAAAGHANVVGRVFTEMLGDHRELGARQLGAPLGRWRGCRFQRAARHVIQSDKGESLPRGRAHRVCGNDRGGARTSDTAAIDGGQKPTVRHPDRDPGARQEVEPQPFPFASVWIGAEPSLGPPTPPPLTAVR